MRLETRISNQETYESKSILYLLTSILTPDSEKNNPLPSNTQVREHERALRGPGEDSVFANVQFKGLNRFRGRHA